MPNPRVIEVKEYEPPYEVTPLDATKYRVFLKHHLGEMEVDVNAVQEHIRLSGHLPAVGKPLLTTPEKSHFGHKRFAVPYGRVVRIERHGHNSS